MTNGEKYVTPEQRSKAFHKWCKHKQHTWCEECLLGEHEHCAMSWLGREAEEEKPLPCPFCGRSMEDCFIGVVTWKGTCACGYETQFFPNKQDAILAHNRVARAVMAAKGSEAK